MAATTQQSLAILSQTSLAVESFSQNGENKNIHYVVKNNPFDVEVAVSAGDINFSNSKLSATLLYDCPELKEVACVRVKPMTYKGVVNQNKTRCTLEISIAVLSSQHEDMNFRVQLCLQSTISDASLTTITETIQVISKPEVLRKKQQPKKRKRTRNDTILEALNRIEEVQKRQQEQLDSFRNTNGGAQQPASSSPSFSELSFEDSFKALINAYNKLDADQKPTKIRKVLHNNKQEDTQRMFEIMDSLWAAERTKHQPELLPNSPENLSLPDNLPFPLTDANLNLEEFYTDLLA